MDSTEGASHAKTTRTGSLIHAKHHEVEIRLRPVDDHPRCVAHRKLLVSMGACESESCGLLVFYVVYFRGRSRGWPLDRRPRTRQVHHAFYRAWRNLSS